MITPEQKKFLEKNVSGNQRATKSCCPNRRIEMKNHLVDLHNHLFAQIERLGDEDLNYVEFANEVARADAIVNIAGQIVANANVIMEQRRLSKIGRAHV
jgi:hypothetical protein